MFKNIFKKIKQVLKLNTYEQNYNDYCSVCFFNSGYIFYINV